MLEEDDFSGQAAIDGTTVGRACELYHNGQSVEAALENAMGENAGADRTFVEGILTEYANDPRNDDLNASLRVLPEFQEREVKIRLRGESGYFYLTGHVDQVREDEDYNKWIWDLKAGRMYGGNQMIDCYAAQQALYAVGMSDLLGEEVGYGGIVRLRGYVGRTNLNLPVEDRPVFFHAQWDYAKCLRFAKLITKSLDDIRRGKPRIAPGSHCCFCPAGGVVNCVDRFA
jgi:hypothetical protein